MNRGARVRAGGVAAAIVLLAAACSEEPPPPPPVDPAALAQAVGIDAVVGHLTELDRIATEHDGNRAVGTAGYDASVDYVAGRLRDAGFDVQTPEFDVRSFDVEAETLTVAGAPVPVRALEFSPSTGSDGLTARLVPVPADDTPGCEASDYEGLDVSGAVVLVTRGVCPFSVKQQVAAERGGGGAPRRQQRGRCAHRRDARRGGRRPRARRGDQRRRRPRARRCPRHRDPPPRHPHRERALAQRARADRHGLDRRRGRRRRPPRQRPGGPGRNDNGTGVAAVLETALQLGSEPGVTNAVRFAFWGAEEVGLVGSTDYVASLDDAGREDIALYLNFDMLGSPNPGYLVYDGDDSDAVGTGPGPEGSAGIERTFLAYLTSRGIAADGTDFDGRSDYGPFVDAGIPAGGVFSGADDRKTPEQAQKWGGTGEEPFDPNYHSPQDTLANIDRAALAVAASAVGYGVGTYARAVTGPDGVPVGPQRTEVRSDG